MKIRWGNGWKLICYPSLIFIFYFRTLSTYQYVGPEKCTWEYILLLSTELKNFCYAVVIHFALKLTINYTMLIFKKKLQAYLGKILVVISNNFSTIVHIVHPSCLLINSHNLKKDVVVLVPPFYLRKSPTHPRMHNWLGVASVWLARRWCSTNV